MEKDTYFHDDCLTSIASYFLFSKCLHMFLGIREDLKRKMSSYDSFSESTKHHRASLG
jgi:hypothetical protein